MRPTVPSSEAFDPDLAKWNAWRPEEVYRRLAAISAPWYVAAGWAIDLFLGSERRRHDDIEIAVPADRFHEIVDALAGLEFFVVQRGLATPLAQAGDPLDTSHQTWVLDRDVGVWRLDVFREPADAHTWICRRAPAIRLPYDELIVRSLEGIPYGRPEVILLFKAKYPQQSKNREDFRAVLPLLESERRRWLAEALQLLHPGHPWLADLE